MRVVAVVLLLLSAGVARAQYVPVYGTTVEEVKPDGPHFTGAIHFGLGAPLGLFGAEGGVGDGPFSAVAGIGIGLRGMELGAMARAKTTVSGIDVGVGLGVSRGPGAKSVRIGWEDNSDPETFVQWGDATVWANLELDVEIPHTRWGATRFFAGVGYAASAQCEVERRIERDTVACDPGQGQMLADEPWMPYAGVAIVLRFPQAPPRQTFQLPGQRPF